MKKLSALLFAAVLALGARPADAQTTIKIATLAPEGSSWMKLFRDWQKAVEARTEGRVKLKFFAGGVQGDEKDVLRKIKLGQLHGAAITGIGLSNVAPEVRALELARSYEELDYLRENLDKDLRAKFEEKGFVVVSWGDVGPVHIFSKKPIKSIEELRTLKLWKWVDDPMSNKLFAAIEANGVPMGVPEVLPGLSTGQIDSFFGSPLSALALQWSSHAKFMTNFTLSQATGATIISKKAFDSLSEADRKALIEESKKMEGSVLKQVRADNTKALDSMKAQGLQVVAAAPEF